GGVAGARPGRHEAALCAVPALPPPAAPLPGDAAGAVPLLGEAAGVQDEDGVSVPQLLGHVPPPFGDDRVVVPGTGADEVLHGLARPAGEGGDRLGGLALELAELAPEDHPGQGALFLPGEAGQVGAPGGPPSAARTPEGPRGGAAGAETRPGRGA